MNLDDKLSNKQQALLLIIIGVIMGVISNKIEMNNLHNDIIVAACYLMDFLAICLVVFGIKEIFKKDD